MPLLTREAFTDNPIFTRELRRRMRGKVMIYSTNAFIGLMCLVAGFILTTGQVFRHQGPSSETGRSLFNTITVIQAVLVLLIAPTITAGMATIERERKTFEFLKVTTLSPFTFIVGGLFSTMLYVLVVLVCALPLICISFLYGGVSPQQILVMFVKLLGASLLLSAAGLWISSTRDKTKSAQGATLILVIVALMLGFSYRDMLTGPGTRGTHVTFFETFPVRSWIVATGAVLFVSGILLVIASRKLYVPENRPLTYTQSLLLLAVLCAGVLGMSWGMPTLRKAETWLGLSWFLLFLIVATQCLHQLEVGNEVWALKKRFRPLRFIDESLLFASVVAIAWAGATWIWGDYIASSSAALGPMPGTLPHLWPRLLGGLAAALLFTAVASRFWAHYCNSREEAFRKLLTWMAVPWLAAPLVGFVILRQTGDADNLLGAILLLVSPLGAWQALKFADPNYVLFEFGGRRMSIATAETAAAAVIGLYLLLTLMLGIYYWRRFVAHRQPVDYSYEISV